MSAHPPDFVVLSIIAMPLVGAALLGLIALAGSNLGERAIGRIAVLCVGASAVASVWTLVDRLVDPTVRIVHAFHWLRLPGHEISVALWIDPLSALMLVMTTVISLVVTWFSVPYLHRESGYLRYFALVLLFVAGMNVLVAGDGFLLLFLGWEWVGVCSALLIGFFHERAAPVRAGARALITNRLGDLGLLSATLFLGHELGGSDFRTMLVGSESLSPAWAAAIGLSLWIAAVSKSAQLPVSNWMAHAVEGPTTSTGLFYGAVMAHAGVYLLLRSGPLLVQSPVAMWATVIVGGATLVVSTAIGAAQTDAKGRLIYATIAQLGGMFIACGLGAWHLATLLMVLHAGLRMGQFLLAPNAIVQVRAASRGRRAQVSQARRALALGLISVATIVVVWGLAGLSSAPWIYGPADPLGPLGEHRDLVLAGVAMASIVALSWVALRKPDQRNPLGWAARMHDLAIHRFDLDGVQDRWVVQPLLRLGRAVAKADGWLRAHTVGLVLAATVVGMVHATVSWFHGPVPPPSEPATVIESPAPGIPWLTLVWVVPLVGAAWVRWRADERVVSFATRLLAIGTVAMVGVIATDFDLGKSGLQFVDRSTRDVLGIGYHVGVDGLSLMFVAIVALVTAVVFLALAPRLSRSESACLLTIEGLNLLALASVDLMIVGLALLVAVAPASSLLRLHVRFHRIDFQIPVYTRPAMLSAALVIGSVLLLGLGVDAPRPFDYPTLVHAGIPFERQFVVLALLMPALAISVPLPPFHGWALALFERAPAAVAIPLLFPSLGMYLFVRLGGGLLPSALMVAAMPLALAAVLGALWCALVGLVRGSLAGAMGNVLVAVGATVIVSIATPNIVGPTSGLLGGANLALAGAGLVLCVEFVRNRLGTTDFAALGGVVRTAPRFTVLMLLAALSYSGFPGTLGFVAEHLVTHGAFETHPAIAWATIAVVNLASVVVWLAFIRTTLGPLRSPAGAMFPELRGRELLGLAVLVLVLLVLAWWAEPFLQLVGPSLVTHPTAASWFASPWEVVQ